MNIYIYKNVHYTALSLLWLFLQNKKFVDLKDILHYFSKHETLCFLAIKAGKSKLKLCLLFHRMPGSSRASESRTRRVPFCWGFQWSSITGGVGCPGERGHSSRLQLPSGYPVPFYRFCSLGCMVDTALVATHPQARTIWLSSSSSL